MLNPFPAVDEAAWLGQVTLALKGGALPEPIAWDAIAVPPLLPGRTDRDPLPYAETWSINVRVDHPDPALANAQALNDLVNGADGLTLVFRSGRSAHGFGLVGSDAGDLDRVLKDVDLGFISLRLEARSDAILQTCDLAALIKRRGLAADRCRVDFGLDPIGGLSQKSLFLDDEWPELSRRTEMQIRALAAAGFAGPYLRADARVWHEAGAPPDLELGATLATAVAYARLLEAAGMATDQAFAGISFTVPVTADWLLSVSKLRALTYLWMAVQSESGCQPVAPTVHAETSWLMLTWADAANNILRNALAAFAATLGGCASLTVLPHTSAHGLPEADARRLAATMQHVLKAEAMARRSLDPAAGSGTLEAMTDSLIERGWREFQAFERRNGQAPGIVRDLNEGLLRNDIERARAVTGQQFADRTRTLVGVTGFQPEHPQAVAIEAIGPVCGDDEASDMLVGPRWSEAFERGPDKP